MPASNFCLTSATRFGLLCACLMSESICRALSPRFPASSLALDTIEGARLFLSTMKKQMSASQIPELPVHFSKPPTIQDDAKGHIHRAAVILNQLANEKTIPEEQRAKADRARKELWSAQDILCAELPGMTQQFKKPKSRATEEDVVAFVLGLKKGLTAEDGSWFFWKCEGCDWTNNGKPIKNWKATVMSWEIARVFPSQKRMVNGKLVSGPKPLSIAEKESVKMLRESEGI
jgi:hypothetical protein